jgi:hypothetical protein
MEHNDTPPDEKPGTSDIYRPPSIGTLGNADVRIEIDEETYHRIHDEYADAVEHGYTDDFDLFVFNHCSTTYTVTVDGEPVNPDVDG